MKEEKLTEKFNLHQTMMQSIGPKINKFMPWAKGKDVGAILYLLMTLTDFKELNAINKKSPGKFKKWIKAQAKAGKIVKEGKLTENLVVPVGEMLIVGHLIGNLK